jgi:hypothetical protein
VTRDDDRLARLERVVSSQGKLEEELKLERERDGRMFDPGHVPGAAEEALASRIHAELEPRVRADVRRLQPHFEELVASDSWKRLRKLTRQLERFSCVLLPCMAVSLPRERARPARSVAT